MTSASTRLSGWSRVWRWCKRLCLSLIALMVLLVAAGAFYEALSRHWAAVKYPPPGRLVDIGGRSIHLDCRGQGSPTVIFEAGLDISGSLSWIKVHDVVAGVTRACTYDRAGIMWSDPKTTTQHADHVANDLHATLAAAGEKEPFILVGHSLGGPYSMAYTRKFGDQVAGLVFVDASHPGQVARFDEVVKTPPDSTTDAMKIASSLAWTGIIRLTAPGEGQPNVPAGVIEQTNSYASTSLAGALSENMGIGQTLAEAGTLRRLGNRPLVVLTAMAPLNNAILKGENMSREEEKRRRDVWKTLQEDEASWSMRSRHQLLPDSTHYIQFDRPDVVITAVQEVVDMVRADRQKGGGAGSKSSTGFCTTSGVVETILEGGVE